MPSAVKRGGSSPWVASADGKTLVPQNTGDDNFISYHLMVRPWFPLIWVELGDSFYERLEKGYDKDNQTFYLTPQVQGFSRDE